MEAGITDESLIELIDFELARLTSEENASGWTVKALLAALAALVWILLSLIGKQEYSAPDIVSLCVMATISIDFLNQLAEMLSPGLALHDDKSRHKSALIELGHKRLSILFHASRNLVLLWFIHITAWQLNLVASIGFQICLWEGVVMASFALTLSVLDIPISSSHKHSTKIEYIWKTLDISIPVVAIVSSLFSFYSTIPHTNAGDIRVAAIITAIIVLLELLTNMQRPKHLVAVLTNLRHRLSLGEIDIAPARAQVEIFLLGKDMANEIQDRIAPILTHIQKAESLMKSASGLSRELREKAEYAKSTGSSISTTEVEAYQSILHMTFRQVNNEVKEGRRQFKLLSSPLRLILMLGTAGAAEFADKLASSFNEIHKNVEERIQIIEDDLKAIE